MHSLSRVLETLVRVVSPPRCLLCNVPLPCVRASCDACIALLPSADTATCPGCALPSLHGVRCGSCQSRPPPFDSTIAAFWFAPPVDRTIRALKFRGQLAAAPQLGVGLADAVSRTAAGHARRPSILIPVPLGHDRLRQRGFNQATEIARSVGQAMNIPVDSSAVRRVRNTPAQTDMPASARERNMRDAFSCQRALAGHVAIVDDVMTTAATAGAMAVACRRAGAQRVSVWIVARVCGNAAG